MEWIEDPFKIAYEVYSRGDSWDSVEEDSFFERILLFSTYFVKPGVTSRKKLDALIKKLDRADAVRLLQSKTPYGANGVFVALLSSFAGYGDYLLEKFLEYEIDPYTMDNKGRTFLPFIRTEKQADLVLGNLPTREIMVTELPAITLHHQQMEERSYNLKKKERATMKALETLKGAFENAIQNRWSDGRRSTKEMVV